MQKLEFKQTLFLKKIKIDDAFLNEIEKIKMNRYGTSVNNYMRLDEETKNKGPFFLDILKILFKKYVKN